MADAPRWQQRPRRGDAAGALHDPNIGTCSVCGGPVYRNVLARSWWHAETFRDLVDRCARLDLRVVHDAQP